MPTYTSQYPPAQSDIYVKVTSKYNTDYWQYFVTDPTKLVTGPAYGNSWAAPFNTITNQRFHIDLGSAKIIRRVYYENYHHWGGTSNKGVKNFTFWGSNTGPGVFDDLVYANDEGWTEINVSQNTLDEHVALDQADPKYIIAYNVISYRYYAFKFADNLGHSNWLGIRLIELQTEDAPPLYKDSSRTGIYTFKTLKI